MAMIISILFQFSSDSTENTLLNLLVIFLIICLVLVLYVLNVSQRILSAEEGALEALEDSKTKKTKKWKWLQNFGFVEKSRSEIPIYDQSRHLEGETIVLDDEYAVMLDHEYDGIRELDNDLPPWWKYGFYFSIIVAVVYFVHFHVIGEGNIMEQEFAAEMAEAKEQKRAYLASVESLVDESTATIMTETADLDVGKKIYIDNCLDCHGVNGEGLVGPNFADEYWIHGGGIGDLFSTIKYGVPAKGMISWQSKLRPVEIQQVSSYILAFQGTDPPNQKEPQGELYKGE